MVPLFTTAAGLILTCIAVLASGQVQLKVGLYNSIPDLQGDGFTTLKNMVQQGFNDEVHTVDAVVDENQYSPYGNLNSYLDGDFDLIEIDTANLLDVISKIVDVESITEMQASTLQTARDSVKAGAMYYGYPTLACGNFMVALSPGTGETCPLDHRHLSYTSIIRATQTCKYNFVPPYERVLGGKMNDGSGWYLPFLYLDGYVDIYGPDSVGQGVEDVVKGIVNREVCSGLQWLLDQCKAGGETLDTNKCWNEYIEGSYAKDFNNVINDIEDGKTLTFFGFSEKTAMIQKEVGVVPYGLTSWPFNRNGDSYMLQFTDALVVSRKAWEAANEEKQNAIRAFINYFTAADLRRRIALGEDLNPVRNRYLLQAIREFYASEADDPVYSSAYNNLVWSVAAPSLSDEEKAAMQQVLEVAITGDCNTQQQKKSEL